MGLHTMYKVYLITLLEWQTALAQGEERNLALLLGCLRRQHRKVHDANLVLDGSKNIRKGETHMECLKFSEAVGVCLVVRKQATDQTFANTCKYMERTIICEKRRNLKSRLPVRPTVYAKLSHKPQSKASRA